MLLMIDNYDSFTYNLVQYFGELGEDVLTYRNDEITLDEIAKLNPERICLSPGPSNPQHAGITLDVLREFSGKLPILGVCLGHQAIGEAFGGRVVRAQTIMHGKVSQIETDCKGVFADLPKHFNVTRYHSLAIERESLPTVWKCPRGRPTVKSWVFVTVSWKWKACSSIRNRFFPSTATRCSKTS